MRTGILVVAVALAGCATPRDSDATPMIAVSPGLTGRLALMDAYRLNDSREVRVMAADGTPLVSAEDATEAEPRVEVIEAPVPPAR